jgi:hypothetical protein
MRLFRPAYSLAMTMGTVSIWAGGSVRRGWGEMKKNNFLACVVPFLPALLCAQEKIEAPTEADTEILSFLS